MTDAPLRVIIAGGGTGGHLYPGLAVAREILARRPDAVVTFAGTARGLEARVVPKEGLELDLVRSAGLKGKSPAAMVRGVGLLPVSLIDAWRIVAKRKPSIVIGVGGSSSGPVVLAAALRGAPTMLMEQNALPGAANRTLARVVRAAAVSFESTLPFFRGKGFVSGNPVRAEFFRAGDASASASAARPRHGAPRVLVFGGSQGAHSVNVAMVDAAPTLAAEQPSLAIEHQTGTQDVEIVRDGYRRAGLEARVEPFFDRMYDVMASVDLVVCRAGATTIAEIAAAGRPAILAPLATATDDHQRKNGAALVARGAAEMIDPRELTGPRLAGAILALIRDEPRRRAMADAVRQFARPDAARVIVDRALELAAAGRQEPGTAG